jgi:DNA-binding transcriptional MerR regulator
MSAPAVSLTMKQFADELGLSIRVLRSWFKFGLVSPPPRRGRNTRYEAQHVRMARAVQTLRARNMQLASIRAYLGTLTTEQIDALIANGPGAWHAAPVAAPAVAVAVAVANGVELEPVSPVAAPPAPTYAFVRWHYVELVPGLELRVRDDAPVGLRRLAQDIVTHYGVAQSG